MNTTEYLTYKNNREKLLDTLKEGAKKNETDD